MTKLDKIVVKWVKDNRGQSKVMIHITYNGLKYSMLQNIPGFVEIGSPVPVKNFSKMCFAMYW